MTKPTSMKARRWVSVTLATLAASMSGCGTHAAGSSNPGSGSPKAEGEAGPTPSDGARSAPLDPAASAADDSDASSAPGVSDAQRSEASSDASASVDGAGESADAAVDAASNPGDPCSPIVAPAATAFGPLTMYTPPSGQAGPGDFYARAVELHHAGPCNGRMAATFELYEGTRPVFPIYESVDRGRTWSRVSEVRDTVNGWGLRFQPFLYELPEDIGALTAGTVLLAGNSIPADFSRTKIDLYKSTDGLRTWTFVSSIATGGRATIGADPVWEPFLMAAGKKLLCYYSDETDPAHSQKLVHRASADGVTWSAPVDDVALSDASLRPGMAVVAQMPNREYILTYEDPPRGHAYFKVSLDPESWNPASEGTAFSPGGSPYVTVMPGGAVVVSASGTPGVFVNTANATGPWKQVPAPVHGYSRALVPVYGGNLFTIVAGDWGGTGNTVTYGEIAFP